MLGPGSALLQRQRHAIGRAQDIPREAEAAREHAGQFEDDDLLHVEYGPICVWFDTLSVRRDPGDLLPGEER